MPYVRCPRCAVRSYRPAPWSEAAECPICGTELDVRRHGSVEDRVREMLHPRWSERVPTLGGSSPR